MKKVTTTKRRFGYKDIISWSLITLAHYFSFAIYLGLFILIKYLTVGGDLWPHDAGAYSWVILTIAFGPAVNAALHITYDEIGSPWTRFAMWVHSFIHMILIPILVFVFF